MKIRRSKGKIEPKKDTLKDRLEQEYEKVKTNLAKDIVTVNKKGSNKYKDLSYKIGLCIGVLSALETEYKYLYKVPIPNEMTIEEQTRARELTNKDNQSKELPVKRDTIKEQIEKLTNIKFDGVHVVEVELKHGLYENRVVVDLIIDRMIPEVNRRE